MSYFICGFKTSPATFRRLADEFAEVVPRPLRAAPLHPQTQPPLVLYGHQRVIPHVAIQGDGSWLVIVGTPLLRFGSEKERQDLLDQFLRDPAGTLCHAIDGNFAVVAYDATRDRMLAATDINNSTPVFYAVTPNGVLLSSHELPLARHLTPEIDPFGFSQAIHLGVTWTAHTRFRGIAKLLPCQILSIESAGGPQLLRYWHPRDERPWTGALDDHLERWGSLLRESINTFYECAGRRPVLADLTAGEDSRLLVAQCHALEIPFTAHVRGEAQDVDVHVAARAAGAAGFGLIQRRRHHIDSTALLANAVHIPLASDAYLSYFTACSDFATDLAEPLDDYGIVKFCGLPGGEAFRGSYYLRGKAIFPSRRTALDYKFFTRMKFLLDHRHGLVRYPDADFVEGIHEIARAELEDVREFPIGTQIDHMLRMFQTCATGLMYKDPLYLPLATNRLTRSVYGLPPRFKRGGRLTRACTELLFPELAVIDTDSGVPTIRRTLRRQPLFWPEHVAAVRSISKGALGRLFKWTRPDTWSYRKEVTADVFVTLLNASPYREWFSSAATMVTGHLYDPAALNSLLTEARNGSCRYIPTLDRLIGQELALRWVYREASVSDAPARAFSTP